MAKLLCLFLALGALTACVMAYPEDTTKSKSRRPFKAWEYAFQYACNVFLALRTLLQQHCWPVSGAVEPAVGNSDGEYSSYVSPMFINVCD